MYPAVLRLGLFFFVQLINRGPVRVDLIISNRIAFLAASVAALQLVVDGLWVAAQGVCDLQHTFFLGIHLCQRTAVAHGQSRHAKVLLSFECGAAVLTLLTDL